MAGILIVDDDPTIRAMFARALKPLGDIETAANGAEALRLLGARKYSIVLLDLHMPVIDGFVLLHTLSNKPGPNRDTPIYVITADTSEQARLRALRRHALFLLTKPIPIATLVALVDSALKKAAARAAAGIVADDGVEELEVDAAIAAATRPDPTARLTPAPVTMGETPKPPAQPVTMGETPKPPAQPVTMGETPKPPAQPVMMGEPPKQPAQPPKPAGRMTPPLRPVITGGPKKPGS